MTAVLIPARRQIVWRAPAVANFVLGGLGAGLYLAAALAASVGESRSLGIAAWLGPALVAAGFGAVATEAGRPWRGIRVLRAVGTSWMSRELWLGGAFIALAVAERFAPGALARGLACGAAAGLIVAQGCMLRSARGIPAWDVAAMPAVFAASGAISGAGLLLGLEVVAGRRPGVAFLGAVLALLVAGFAVWLAYLGRGEAAFATAVAPLQEGRTGVAVIVLGYAGPYAAATFALAFPDAARPLAAVAAALMIAGQARLKWALVREVATLHPVTVPTLTLRRTV
jgi:DMSO reductase anchor subunit